MLTDHEQTVLRQLESGEWLNQAELKTSRQTLNKLVKAGLIKEKISNPRPYQTVRNKRYRLC